MNEGVVCKTQRDDMTGRKHCQLLHCLKPLYRHCLSDILFRVITFMEEILRKFISFMRLLDISVICA
jgi:hypothetical protein